MRKRLRLPSRERRQAIVTAVQGAFADKGFDGTTTRELARAAGVSEALIYKESLCAAMLEACADRPMAVEFTRVLALPPSTSTLVVLVHFLTSHFVLHEDLQKTTMHRHPKIPTVDYGISRSTLVIQAVWFLLRGMGLEEAAIRRHYHPEALSHLTS